MSLTVLPLLGVYFFVSVFLFKRYSWRRLSSRCNSDLLVLVTGDYFRQPSSKDVPHLSNVSSHQKFDKSLPWG